MPLIYWTVKAACGCHFIDIVYVSTDSIKIRETVESFRYGNESLLFSKLQVVNRSTESANDTASTEMAMLEFAEKFDFENIVLIQATSPLLSCHDLDRGFEEFSSVGTDSVISVVSQKRFHWSIDTDGYARPSNYDVFHRPRRQDFKGYFVENGAFYITTKNNLIRTGNRVSGNIKAVEMNEDSFFEIDEPSDWVIVEALMKKNGFFPSLSGANVKMFLSDCDGCMTDGGMYYSEHGDELKKFNAKDGMGFALLKKKGIITGILTKETVNLNRRRAEKLQLDILSIGCKDKLKEIEALCEEFNIQLENVLFIGDDINDIEAIEKVGYGCCPKDAIPEVRAIAKYITEAKGGEGVIREIVDKII